MAVIAEVLVASMVVEVSVGPTAAARTAAITAEVEKVRCMAVTAPETCAEIRHRRVMPVQRGLGLGKAAVERVTPHPAGIRFQEQATTRAWQEDPVLEVRGVERAAKVWPQPMPRLPTGIGTLSETLTAPLYRPWP